MLAPVCPIGSQELTLQFRLNRGRSNGGEAKIVSPWQSERVGEGLGNQTPPANQLGELFASSRNPEESGWDWRYCFR